MSNRRWTVAALFAVAPFFLAPRVGHAVTEANFNLTSTADLVELCDAKPDNTMGVAALNFCYGFAQGAVVTEMQNMGDRAQPNLFCLPNPLPRRSDSIGGFVQWARASPDRMSDGPTNSLIRFLADRYPCPKNAR